MTAPRSLLGEILVSSLMEPGAERRASLDDLVRGQDLSGLAALAAAHRVSNAVYRALTGLDGVTPSELELLGQEYHSSLRRHLRALVDLGSVSEVLGTFDIPWLAVKGPVLSELLYGADHHRNYVDLDVLVPRARFRTAVEACVDHGLAVVQTDWEVAVRELAGELCLILPSGTAMDLHWDLLYHDRSRRTFSVRVEEMFDRAIVADLGGVTVRTFDPADTLLHLTLHAAKGGGVRLQWLKDIERAVTVGRPDWDAVVSRAREWRLTLVAGVMLDRARRVLAAPVPSQVTRALGGGPWRQLVHTADRLRPVQQTLGRHAISTMVVRATGRSGWSSMWSLGQQAWTSIRASRPGPTGYEVRRGRDDELDVFLRAVSDSSAVSTGDRR